jgi:transketolase
MGTGSEIHLAVEAAEILTREGRRVRVVSMPCAEVFAAQSEDYQESVLPSAVRVRVAVEAAHVDWWRKYVGLDGRVVGMSGFGESAPGNVLFDYFGITTEAVVVAAREMLK